MNTENLEFYSQPWIGQDKFVAETFKYKKNGTFLDIGCNDYKDRNNTYFLEKNLNWIGVGVDTRKDFKDGWDKNRTSKFVTGNGTILDFKKVLDENNMPQIIDYLSIDTEPSSTSFKCLLNVFKSGYDFNVITFETDEYNTKPENSIQELSRIFLKNKGFVLIKEVRRQDDFYIHQRMLNG
jgi:hypothetical protein